MHEIRKSNFQFIHNAFKSIDPSATKIHHLSRVGKKLYKQGVEVPPLSKKEAITKVIEFLQKIGPKCLLVAHNDKFDAPRVVHLMQDLGLDGEFQKLIYGFTDSLKLFREALPELTCHSWNFLQPINSLNPVKKHTMRPLTSKYLKN